MHWNPLDGEPPEDYESQRPHLLIPVEDAAPGRLRLDLVRVDDEAVDPIGELRTMLRDNEDPMFPDGMDWSPEDLEHAQGKIDDYQPSVYTYPEWSWEGWTDRIADYLRQRVFGEDMLFGRDEDSYQGDFLRGEIEQRCGDIGLLFERITTADEFQDREPWDGVIDAILTTAQFHIDREARDWPNRPVLKAYWPMLVDATPVPIINNFRSGAGRIVMGDNYGLAVRNNTIIPEHFLRTGRFPERLHIDIGLEFR